MDKRREERKVTLVQHDYHCIEIPVRPLFFSFFERVTKEAAS